MFSWSEIPSGPGQHIAGPERDEQKEERPQAHGELDPSNKGNCRDCRPDNHFGNAERPKEDKKNEGPSEPDIALADQPGKQDDQDRPYAEPDEAGSSAHRASGDTRGHDICS